MPGKGRERKCYVRSKMHTPLAMQPPGRGKKRGPKAVSKGEPEERRISHPQPEPAAASFGEAVISLAV